MQWKQNEVKNRATINDGGKKLTEKLMSQQEPDGEDGFAANVVREAVQRVLTHQATPLATQLRRYRRRSPIPLEQSSSNYQEIERASGHCSILEQQSFFVSHFVFQFHVFISVSFNFFRLPSVFLVQD